MNATVEFYLDGQSLVAIDVPRNGGFQGLGLILAKAFKDNYEDAGKKIKSLISELDCEIVHPRDYQNKDYNYVIRMGPEGPAYMEAQGDEKDFEGTAKKFFKTFDPIERHKNKTAASFTLVKQNGEFVGFSNYSDAQEYVFLMCDNALPHLHRDIAQLYGRSPDDFWCEQGLSKYWNFSSETFQFEKLASLIGFTLIKKDDA